jgi:hypothetical protein
MKDKQLAEQRLMNLKRMKDGWVKARAVIPERYFAHEQSDMLAFVDTFIEATDILIEMIDLGCCENDINEFAGKIKEALDIASQKPSRH